MTLKKDLIDTSNIQTNIPIKKGVNKKALCMWKDELSGFQ